MWSPKNRNQDTVSKLHYFHYHLPGLKFFRLSLHYVALFPIINTAAISHFSKNYPINVCLFLYCKFQEAEIKSVFASSSTVLGKGKHCNVCEVNLASKASQRHHDSNLEFRMSSGFRWTLFICCSFSPANQVIDLESFQIYPYPAPEILVW